MSGKIFVVPLVFLALYTTTISRFGERFRDGQCSLVRFLFVVLFTVSPCPATCKSGGHEPPCHTESAPLSNTTF